MEAKRFLRGLLNLPGLLGLLLFAAGLAAFFLTLRATGPGPRPPAALGLIAVETGQEASAREEVALFVVDEEGHARSETRALDLPVSEQARLERILLALRDLLAGPAGQNALWPESLGAPRVFLVGSGGEGAVVLDFSLRNGDSWRAGDDVSVRDEGRLVTSIRQTVRLHSGSERIYFLVNGQSRPTLLGHVALESSLD